MTEVYYCPLSGCQPATTQGRPLKGRIRAISHTEASRLKVGDKIALMMDNGSASQFEVCSEPWQLRHGAWVVGVDGIRGGYSLERVVGIMEE